MSKPDVGDSLLKELLLEPLAAQKRRFAVMLPALASLALADGALILLMKGFTKALFQEPGRATVPLAELLPEGVVPYLPDAGTRLVAYATLAVAVPLAVAVAGVVKAAATYLYQVSQQAIALYMAKSYRERLFKALLSLPYVEIKKRPAGEWMSLIMNDVMVLQNRFSDVMTVLVKHSVTILAGFVFLFFIHWRTALLLLAIAPFIAFGMGRTGKRIARYSEAFQRELARIAGMILDLRARFDFIRAQGGEEFERRRFQERNLAYYRMILKSILVRSAFAPVLEFMGFFLFAAVVFAVGRGLVSGLTPDLLMQFLVALGLMLKPLKEVGEQLARFHETRGTLAASLATFKRIEELAKTAPVRRAEGASQAEGSGLAIRALGAGMAGEVRFAAENLALSPGRAVAVIGPSGAGKSTLLKTLAGLVEPLRWDANLTWDEAARAVSMVSQDPFLFDDTLLNNLSYGLSVRPSEAEVWRALEAVNIDQEVRGWPEGLATRLRAVGSNVSGGQLQRLVIARGWLRDKPIWLLDEATSAVDAAAEKDITQRLIQGCKARGRSLLAVTHRLTWLEAFDEVWFVEGGRIAHAGKHADLLKQPRYRDFCAREGETA